MVNVLQNVLTYIFQQEMHAYLVDQIVSHAIMQHLVYCVMGEKLCISVNVMRNVPKKCTIFKELARTVKNPVTTVLIQPHAHHAQIILICLLEVLNAFRDQCALWVTFCFMGSWNATANVQPVTTIWNRTELAIFWDVIQISSKIPQTFIVTANAQMDLKEINYFSVRNVNRLIAMMGCSLKSNTWLRTTIS